jgi:hypothetical protein
LQNDLKALESWKNEWQMSFNADKCFIITAGTKNTKINYEYKSFPFDVVFRISSKVKIS